VGDNRSLERMRQNDVCKTVINSLQDKFHWISSLHSMKQSIRSLFDCFRDPEESEEALRNEEAILGSQINEVLVPAMYRFMIGKICSNSSVYRGVCKDLSFYETLIVSEVEFKYETPFNIIWHAHNPNLLFHELPSLIPPVLHSILTHPCSNTVTKHSNNDYLDCAFFYYTQKYPSLEYIADDIRYYGLLMDFIYANILSIDRGEIWSIQPSQKINALLKRASKALLFDSIQYSTKDTFWIDVGDAIPEIIFKKMLGKSLAEIGFWRIDDGRIVLLLTEDERISFVEASGWRRPTLINKFNEIIKQDYKTSNRLLGRCAIYYSSYKEFSKYVEPYLINFETQIKSGDRVFENQESLDRFLVPSMYRRMIMQICKNAFYQKICRPVSAYETMISKDSTKFEYDKGFNMIWWNSHNPDILFHGTIPWLSLIMNNNNPCKFYLEVFGTQYGYIMDSVLNKQGSIKASAIKELSPETLSLLDRVKNLINIPNILNCETEKELVNVLNDSIKSLWHRTLQPHLPSQITPEHFEQYLPEP
jgi:hypothetical protein